MARIKINDIPRDQKISKDEMRKITGGVSFSRNKTIVNPKNISFFGDDDDGDCAGDDIKIYLAG